MPGILTATAVGEEPEDQLLGRRTEFGKGQCLRRSQTPAPAFGYDRRRTPHWEAAMGDWYENVAAIFHLDPLAFAYSYFQRTGRMSHEDLRRMDPAFIANYEAAHGSS